MVDTLVVNQRLFEEFGPFIVMKVYVRQEDSHAGAGDMGSQQGDTTPFMAVHVSKIRQTFQLPRQIHQQLTQGF